MPNWCINDLYIIAKKKGHLAKFCAKAGLKKAKPEFSLARLYPEPDYDKVEVKPTFPMIDGSNEPVSSSRAWWDWRIQNWGTKWDIGILEVDVVYSEFDIHAGQGRDGKVKVERSHYALISFNTAWSPPESALIKIGKDYPEIAFALQYSEPGCDFEGELVIVDGEITLRQSRDWRPEIHWLAEQAAHDIGNTEIEGEK
jgi:hypothetical protein